MVVQVVHRTVFVSSKKFFNIIERTLILVNIKRSLTLLKVSTGFKIIKFGKTRQSVCCTSGAAPAQNEWGGQT